MSLCEAQKQLFIICMQSNWPCNYTTPGGITTVALTYSEGTLGIYLISGNHLFGVWQSEISPAKEVKQSRKTMETLFKIRNEEKIDFGAELKTYNICEENTCRNNNDNMK